MRADFFVHPDFFNRVRNKTPSEIVSEHYVEYLNAVRQKMLFAKFGLLAYLPHIGGGADPNTDPEYIDIFSQQGRCMIPTEFGTGRPYNTEADEALREHLAKVNPDLLVVHGSYAPFCVTDFILSAGSHFPGRIVLGNVLIRDFGDSKLVPHDTLNTLHPGLGDFIDPIETRAYSVIYQ